VFNRSVREHDATVIKNGQQIRINFEPIMPNQRISPVNTFGFDAERTEWKNFSVERKTAPDFLFTFSLSGKPLKCGFLCIAPNKEIINELFSYTPPKVDRDWSVVRLYHLRMKHWNAVDDIQVMLNTIGDSEATTDIDFARNSENACNDLNYSLYYLLDAVVHIGSVSALV
jgi:hypothetical protein